jgi:hypothetical protein
MAGESDGARAPIQHTRQVTIDALCEHFANDTLSIEEFERRVDSAHAATSSQELKALLEDLPGRAAVPAVRGASTPAPRHGTELASPSQVKESEYVVAVFGGSGRSGRWRPARHNYAVAVFGGAELDFREAILPPGVTELKVYTVFGGVEVIVPPGLNVESRGIALMGGFEHVSDEPTSLDADAPTLRITGVALMAGVDVNVRHPGETARDARRRRRLERREMRKRLRGG